MLLRKRAGGRFLESERISHFPDAIRKDRRWNGKMVAVQIIIGRKDKMIDKCLTNGGFVPLFK